MPGPHLCEIFPRAKALGNISHKCGPGTTLIGLLLLAGCGKPLPPGLERVTTGDEDHAFALAPDARRLAWIEGRFPSKTRLAALDLETGRRWSHRLAGYALNDALALGRDGRTVFVEAGRVGRSSRDFPGERALLAADVETGALLRALPLSKPAAVAALGTPEWARSPVAMDADGGWVSLDPERRGFAPEAGFAPGGVLLGGSLFAGVQPGKAGSRIAVFDYFDGPDGKALASREVALTPALFGTDPRGRLLYAHWVPATGLFSLEALDPKTGRSEPRLESDGAVETALETPRALYAVAKDPTRSNATGKAWLSPRVLLVAEKDGKRWRTPWTMRYGRFLGAEADGRLWFAVSDANRPGAWRIDPSTAALAAAGASLDGDLSGLGPAARFMALRVLLGVAGAGALLLALMGMRG